MRKDAQIAIRMTDELRQKLKKKADKEHRSLAQVACMILEAYFDTQEKEGK